MLPHVICKATTLRSVSEELAAMAARAEESDFHFSIVLSLNFLALPKLARVCANTQNRV